MYLVLHALQYPLINLLFQVVIILLVCCFLINSICNQKLLQLTIKQQSNRMLVQAVYIHLMVEKYTELEIMVLSMCMIIIG